MKRISGRAVKTALFFCALFVHDNPVTAWRKPSIFAAWRAQCLRRLASLVFTPLGENPVFTPLDENPVFISLGAGSGFVGTFGVQADAPVPFVQADKDSRPVQAARVQQHGEVVEQVGDFAAEFVIVAADRRQRGFHAFFADFLRDFCEATRMQASGVGGGRVGVFAGGEFVCQLREPRPARRRFAVVNVKAARRAGVAGGALRFGEVEDAGSERAIDVGI